MTIKFNFEDATLYTIKQFANGSFITTLANIVATPIL